MEDRSNDFQQIQKERLCDLSKLNLKSGNRRELFKMITEDKEGPYTFRSGEVGVRVEYSRGSQSLQQCIENILKMCG